MYFLKANGRIEEYKASQLDTTVWRNKLAYNEPYISYYYQHPAYKDYPVVGMSLEQAKAYANWLTEIFALKDDDVEIEFSIPTKVEWMRAARGERASVYPWGGPYMRNSKGLYLANFKTIDASSEHYNTSTEEYEIRNQGLNQNDGGFITTPVGSY